MEKKPEEKAGRNEKEVEERGIIRLKGCENTTFMRETRDCGCIVDINPFGARRYVKRCRQHSILKIKRVWGYSKNKK